MEIIGANGKYFGQIVDGKRNGEGVEKYNNGDVYRGHFENNMKGKQGEYISSNGRILKGNFDCIN